VRARNIADVELRGVGAVLGLVFCGVVVCVVLLVWGLGADWLVVAAKFTQIGAVLLGLGALG